MALIRNEQIRVTEPFDMEDQRVIQVATPITGSDAATKLYVDLHIWESGSGDMYKSVYDTNDDGVVNSASFAITASYLINLDNLENVAYTDRINIFTGSQYFSTSHDRLTAGTWTYGVYNRANYTGSLANFIGLRNTNYWQPTATITGQIYGYYNSLHHDAPYTASALIGHWNYIENPQGYIEDLFGFYQRIRVRNDIQTIYAIDNRVDYDSSTHVNTVFGLFVEGRKNGGTAENVYGLYINDNFFPDTIYSQSYALFSEPTAPSFLSGSLILDTTASYQSDLSSVYNDRSLVDKGYIDTVTGSMLATTASFSHTASYSSEVDRSLLMTSSSFAISSSYAPTKDGVISGSTQVDYEWLQNIPAGIVSSSEQIDYNSIQNQPTLITSSSYSTTSSYASNVPSGIYSSSAQVDHGAVGGLTDDDHTQYYNATRLNTWATAFVFPSSSYSITASFAENVVSTWDGITGKPAGLVSSSAQVDYTQIQNQPTSIDTSSYSLYSVTSSHTTDPYIAYTDRINYFTGSQYIESSISSSDSLSHYVLALSSFYTGSGNRYIYGFYNNLSVYEPATNSYIRGYVDRITLTSTSTASAIFNRQTLINNYGYVTGNVWSDNLVVIQRNYASVVKNSRMLISFSSESVTDTAIGLEIESDPKEGSNVGEYYGIYLKSHPETSTGTNYAIYSYYDTPSFHSGSFILANTASYQNDYSSVYNDRSLVDKGYIDTISSSMEVLSASHAEFSETSSHSSDPYIAYTNVENTFTENQIISGALVLHLPGSQDHYYYSSTNYYSLVNIKTTFTESVTPNGLIGVNIDIDYSSSIDLDQYVYGEYISTNILTPVTASGIRGLHIANYNSAADVNHQRSIFNNNIVLSPGRTNELTGIWSQVGGTGIVTDAYGLYAKFLFPGTLENEYGIYLTGLGTAVSSSYAIYAEDNVPSFHSGSLILANTASYQSDYSSVYNDRSLVDKGYVDTISSSMSVATASYIYDETIARRNEINYFTGSQYIDASHDRHIDGDYTYGLYLNATYTGSYRGFRGLRNYNTYAPVEQNSGSGYLPWIYGFNNVMYHNAPFTASSLQGAIFSTANLDGYVEGIYGVVVTATNLSYAEEMNVYVSSIAGTGHSEVIRGLQISGNPAAYTYDSIYGIYISSSFYKGIGSEYVIYSEADVPSYHRGDVGINELQPSESLHVDGNIFATGYFTASSVTSNTLPVYTFFGDEDTGYGHGGSNQLSLMADGLELLSLSGIAGHAYYEFTEMAGTGNRMTYVDSSGYLLAGTPYGDIISGSTQVDHGSIQGLADDDHTQYYNVTRLNAYISASPVPDSYHAETASYADDVDRTLLMVSSSYAYQSTEAHHATDADSATSASHAELADNATTASHALSVNGIDIPNIAYVNIANTFTENQTISADLNLTGTLNLSSTASYQSDYSSLYNDRSLVDKAYVDSVTGSIATSGSSQNAVYAETASYMDPLRAGDDISDVHIITGSVYISGALYVNSDESIGLGNDISDIIWITGSVYHTGSYEMTGLFKYKSDYSSLYDDRSLVDKGYVDSISSSIVPDTASYALYAVTASYISGSSALSGTPTYIAQFNNAGDNVEDSIAHVTGSDTLYVSGALQVITEGVNQFGDSIDDQHEFTGSVYISGSVKYITDFSAEYTDRSLVDKGYVDSISGSYTYWDKAGNNLYPASPSDNVIIGSDYASASLHVWGAEISGSVLPANTNILIEDTSAYMVLRGEGSSTWPAGILLGAVDNSMNSYWGMNHDTDGSFVITHDIHVLDDESPGYVYLMIEQNGYVGIGKSITTESLDNTYLTLVSENAGGIANSGSYLLLGRDNTDTLVFSIDDGGNAYFIGDLEVDGNITAYQYIVSSSVTYMTQSFSSGSTMFGDSIDDTHIFTGSVYITGSFYVNDDQIFDLENVAYINVMNQFQTDQQITGSLLISGSLNGSASIWFGDGDTGFYEWTDDHLIFKVGNATWDMNSTTFGGLFTDGPVLRREAATATNPTFIPAYSDVDTGMGAAGANTGSLIAGGVNVLDWEPARVDISGSLRVGTDLRPANSNHELFVDGHVMIGKGMDYAAADARTDVVVSHPTGNSRLLFGQNASYYGGLIWEYNPTPTNSWLTIYTNLTNDVLIKTDDQERFRVSGDTGLVQIISSSRHGSYDTDTHWITGSLIISKSALYADDFSSEYTDRSLVDKEYVDGLAYVAEYTASIASASTGTENTGSVSSSWIPGDTDIYEVQEVTGTPGFDIRFTFENVISFNQVILYSYYHGGSNHSVHIELYNTSSLSWDEIYEYTDEGGFVFHVAPVINGQNYIDVDGDVLLRLYHDDSGIVTHYQEVDYLVLRNTPVLGAVGGVTDHGGLTGLSDDDHQQYYDSDRLNTWYTSSNFAHTDRTNYFTGSQYVNSGSINLQDGNWLRGQYGSGSYVNMFRINSDNEIEVGGTLNIGTIELTEDSGLVTLVNMPVSSTPSQSTAMGYTFAVDSDAILRVYSEADGVGSVENERVDIYGGLTINRTEVSTATYTTSGSDYYLGVTRTLTGACTITLATNSVANGRIVNIKDEGGNAFTNNITIIAESGSVDGTGSFVINQDYEAIVLISDGASNWFVN